MKIVNLNKPVKHQHFICNCRLVKDKSGQAHHFHSIFSLHSQIPRCGARFHRLHPHPVRMSISSVHSVEIRKKVTSKGSFSYRSESKNKTNESPEFFYQSLCLKMEYINQTGQNNELLPTCLMHYIWQLVFYGLLTLFPQ